MTIVKLSAPTWDGRHDERRGARGGKEGAFGQLVWNRSWDDGMKKEVFSAPIVPGRRKPNSFAPLQIICKQAEDWKVEEHRTKCHILTNQASTRLRALRSQA